MSYQVGSTCYGTMTEAAQAQASAAIGAIVTQGGNAHSVSTTTIDDTSITYVLTPAAGGTPITHVAPYTAQPCNMLQLSDGIQLGWMVGGVWIATYCVMFIARALRGETGENYGNT